MAEDGYRAVAVLSRVAAQAPRTSSADQFRVIDSSKFKIALAMSV